MTVYIDNLRPCLKSKIWPYPESCHLIADSIPELHKFAINKLGLKPYWFQNRKHLPHYDLTKNMRRKAVRLGAVQIGDAQVALMMKRSRDRLRNLTSKPDEGSR